VNGKLGIRNLELCFDRLSKLSPPSPVANRIYSLKTHGFRHSEVNSSLPSYLGGLLTLSQRLKPFYGYSLQRETLAQIVKYSTPSSKAVHPSRGEFSSVIPPPREKYRRLEGRPYKRTMSARAPTLRTYNLSLTIHNFPYTCKKANSML
jgi:hypothetical protein